MPKNAEKCQKTQKNDKWEKFSHAEKISATVSAWHYLKNGCQNSGRMIEGAVYLRRYQAGVYDQADAVCPECGEIIMHYEHVERAAVFATASVPATWTQVNDNSLAWHPNWPGCPGAGLLVHGHMYRRVLLHEPYDEGNIVCSLCGMDIDGYRIRKDGAEPYEYDSGRHDEVMKFEQRIARDRQRERTSQLLIGADGLPF